MSLTTRVSLFFLGSLALTLAGFSGALYLLAAGHLGERLDRQAASALAALTAAVEIKPDGVEWEPEERRLDLPGVRWLVLDPQGVVIGSSPEPPPDDLAALLRGATPLPARVSRAGGRWRVLRAAISPAGPPRSAAEPLPTGLHPSLVLAVAVPAGPDDTSLARLGAALVGLSLVLWSAAALAGRWLCARTLAPVSRMASSARALPAGEPGGRLDVAATGDELEDLGRSFNGLLGRLQEAFERQRRFTGEASHQLRTPLAVMLGQVEVALRRDRPAEEYRRVLGIVAEQSQRLHQIVEMLLFLARADADAASPTVAPLPLRPWLEQHLAALASHPRAADLRLADHQVGDGDGPRALAHAPLLGQVVDILIDNALKYSPRGRPVTLALGAEEGLALIAVEDQGRGIDADDLPRVFEPFFRSPHPGGGNAGGVGLGLAIARRVVEAAGGRILVESEPGRGSRFVVCLPAAPETTITDEGVIGED